MSKPVRLGPLLEKGKLIPLDDNDSELDESKHITVQFNPATLKVSLSNTLKADSKGGDSGSSAQFVDKSSSSLSVELLFDTTVDSDLASANSDVRALTQKLADTFMAPRPKEKDANSDEKPKAPLRCRFQWGAFKFVGMMASYNETLDFFSPEGIPLRAKLGLSLKEDKYQFERDESVTATRGKPPRFSSAPKNAVEKQTAENESLPQVLKKEKKDQSNFRGTAMTNGIENPRELGGKPVQVPKTDPPVPESRQLDGSKASPGFKHGKSDTLGSHIPGAFSKVNKTKNRASQTQRRVMEAKKKARQAKKIAQQISDRIGSVTQDVRDY